MILPHHINGIGGGGGGGLTSKQIYSNNLIKHVNCKTSFNEVLVLTHGVADHLNHWQKISLIMVIVYILSTLFLDTLYLIPWQKALITCTTFT